MAARLVFLNWIVAHLIGRFSCAGCGAAEQPRIVHYPAITRRGDQVELRFRVECSCGKTGWLRVQLPVLLFGYLLAWQMIFEADKHGRAARAPVQVMGHESALFPRIIAEYVQLVGRLPTASTEPTYADQVGFRLNDEEWGKFIKRLGFEGDGEPAKP